MSQQMLLHVLGACFREIYSFKRHYEEFLFCKELQTTTIAGVLEKIKTS